MIPELKSGMRAYFDCFGGLIPVQVLSVKYRREGSDELRSSSEHDVTVRVTKDGSGYRKGETLTEWSLRIVPPKALKRGKYHTRIGFYTVKADQS